MLTVAALEALAMHNRWAAFIILFFGNPHLLKSRERSQNRASDPNRVLALRRRNNLDLHGRRGERSKFPLHAIDDARIHGRTTRLPD